MQLVDRLLAGDRRALARAITYVENRVPEARQIIESTFGRTGQAHIIGITGPPGAGKSTLVDRLTAHFRSQGKTVGVVAVDPTSPFSGGAILGDRVRMQRTAMDPGVFFRSLATRGHLGGLSIATGDVINLMDAFGYDVILVETVGAGQSEVEVMRLVHTTVVVLVPGLGDDVQAIKAGILEIGDVFAVNKADRDGADRTASEVEMMLDLANPDGGALARLDPTGHHANLVSPAGGANGAKVPVAPARQRWRPPVVKVIARDDQGIDTLADKIAGHLAELQETGRWHQRKQDDARIRLVDIVSSRVAQAVLGRAADQGDLDRLTSQVADRSTDPYSAADEIVAKYFRLS